jgi:hypothetical protein
MKKAAAKKAAEKKAKEKKAKEKKAKEKRSKAPKKDRAAAKKAPGRSNKKYGSSPAGKTARTAKKDQQAPKTWWGQTRETLRKNWKPTDLKSKSFIPDLSYEGLKGALPPQLRMAVSVMETAAKVVGRWIDGNEKLSKSFANLTTAGSSFTDSVLQEWLGEGDAVRGIMDKITTALGGQSEAMKEMNRPLGMYKTATDLAKDAQKKFNDELTKEQTLLDDLAGKLANQLAIQQQQLRTAEAQAEFRAEDAHTAVDASKDDDTTKKRKHLEIERQLLNDKLNIRMQERHSGLAPEAKELQARKDRLEKSEKQLVAQRDKAKRAGDLKIARQRLADIENMEEGDRGPNYDRVLKKARETAKNAEQAAIGLGTDEQEGNKIVALEESIKTQKAEIKPLQQKVDTDAQLVGMQNGQDALETNRKIAGINGQLDALRGKSADSPQVLAATKEANIGLNNLGRGSQDPEADLKILALQKALNDGQGNQREEAQVIQNMLANMTGNSEANKALLNQALSQMNNLQTDGSRMQQALTGVLNGLIQNQRELASMLQGMQGQINNNDLALRR